MFTRPLMAVVVTIVIAATVADAAATATDEPAPKPTPAPQTCVDTMRPVSRVSSNLRVTLRRGVIRGFAIDQGCGAAGAGKVKRVDVAISRKVGKRCQALRANRRLGRVGACRHVWLHAKGTSRWSLRLGHKLPRGTYVVATRAIDSAGNRER